LKYLVATLLIIVALTVGACTANDPVDNIYTKNIYPGNGRYDIGSRGHPYINAYINNMYAGNADLGIVDADVLTVGGVPVSTSVCQWTTDADGISYDSGNVGIGTPAEEEKILLVYDNHGTATKALSVESNNANAGTTGIYDSVVGAKTGTTYGLFVNNATTSHTNGINTYGIYVRSQVTWDGANATNYGLYVDEPTGGTVNVTVHISGLPAYANNAAAVAGGLLAGDLYRTGDDPDIVCVVH